MYIMHQVIAVTAVAVAVSACAGRDAQPVASVQAQDVYSDCTMIRAEIEANNKKAQELADEQELKVAQNVADRWDGTIA
jgi:ABC-type transporter MlaC component